MYAQLDTSDSLVDGVPVAIHRKPKSFSYTEEIDGAVVTIIVPRNWMIEWDAEHKAADHLFPMVTNTWDTDRYQASGADPTYTFDGVKVTQTIPTMERPAAALDIYKAKAYVRVDGAGANKILLAETTPAFGIDYSDNERGRVRATIKRDNKTKKNSMISASDDNLYDHIDLINDAIDVICDNIEAAVDYDSVDIIMETLDVNTNWPTWLPI